MLQISLTLIVKMTTGLEDLHELENEVAEDPLLAMFCTIESEGTPSISTLSRDVERYSVTGMKESYKLILQWLKELKLIDSSKIYAEGKVQEGTAEVYDYLKKVYFDRGFYDGKHFDWLNKNRILFVCRGKQNTKVADQVSEIPAEEYVEEKLASPKEYQPKTERGKRAKEKRDALKEPVEIAERMVDVSNYEERLRAIAVKEKGKKSIEIWLTNIPASVCSAKGTAKHFD